MKEETKITPNKEKNERLERLLKDSEERHERIERSDRFWDFMLWAKIHVSKSVERAVMIVGIMMGLVVIAYILIQIFK